MIRLLFVLFCFLAFSQEEKKGTLKKAEQGLKEVNLVPLIPFEKVSFSIEKLTFSKGIRGTKFTSLRPCSAFFKVPFFSS